MDSDISKKEIIYILKILRRNIPNNKPSKFCTYTGKVDWLGVVSKNS